MSLVREVLAEIGAMFAADLRLSLAVLVLVGFAALFGANGAAPLVVGALLLLGTLAILLGAVLAAARAMRRPPPG